MNVRLPGRWNVLIFFQPISTLPHGLRYYGRLNVYSFVCEQCQSNQLRIFKNVFQKTG